MIRVALTGNIGSGKSTAVQIFSSLGIPVFHADREAKLLYKDPEIKKAVSAVFGDTVFEGQEIDFKKLAAVVFNDTKALRKINEIIHPGVYRKYDSWLKENEDAAYTIHEAAIVFENHLEGHYDVIINVTAPEFVRLERVTRRDGVSADQFYARANKQWPEERKNKKSDFVIINDGKHFLIPQVMNIHTKLTELASHSPGLK